MPTPPPALNLLVLRSPDIDKAVSFYQHLGLVFTRHSHGKGPEHFAAEFDGFVFEIYPARGETDRTDRTRIGFSVVGIDKTVESLAATGIEIVSRPKNSPWGRRAVVRDFDGHTVELVQVVAIDK